LFKRKSKFVALLLNESDKILFKRYFVKNLEKENHLKNTNAISGK